MLELDDIRMRSKGPSSITTLMQTENTEKCICLPTSIVKVVRPLNA